MFHFFHLNINSVQLKMVLQQDRDNMFNRNVHKGFLQIFFHLVQNLVCLHQELITNQSYKEIFRLYNKRYQMIFNSSTAFSYCSIGKSPQSLALMTLLRVSISTKSKKARQFLKFSATSQQSIPYALLHILQFVSIC